MLSQTKIAQLSGPSPFGLDTQVCVCARACSHTNTLIRGFLSMTELCGARQGTPAVQENWNVDRHEHLCVRVGERHSNIT